MRRLLELAAIYDGASRAEAAEIAGVTRQIVRDWVVRFNEGGPEALVTRKAPGQPSRLDTRASRGPGPSGRGRPGAGHRRRGAVALVDLVQWVWERFAVSISRQTLGRELRALEYRKLSARPKHHAQAAGGVTAF